MPDENSFLPEYKMSVFPKIISLKSPVIVILTVSHITCSPLLSLKIRVLFGKEPIHQNDLIHTSLGGMWRSPEEETKKRRAKGKKQRFSNYTRGMISLLNILDFTAYK